MLSPLYQQSPKQPGEEESALRCSPPLQAALLLPSQHPEPFLSRELLKVLAQGPAD